VIRVGKRLKFAVLGAIGCALLVAFMTTAVPRWQAVDPDAVDVQALLDSTLRVNRTHVVFAVGDPGDGSGPIPLGKLDRGGTGSGVTLAVDVDANESLVATASHVCRIEAVTTLTRSSPFGGQIKFVLTTVESGLSVTNVLGQTFQATVVLDDPPTDLCFLRVSGVPGPAARLADRLPPRGARVVHTGAPKGLLGAGLAVTIDGRYAGIDTFDLDGPRSEVPWYLVFSTPIEPGSSGGPVFYRGRVVSVLTMASIPGGNVAFGVELGHIDALSREARLRWLRARTR
jgi:S1-C subfamily serine protease